MEAKDVVAVAPKAQTSWFWYVVQSIWWKMLRPLATGLVYGAGYMLGTFIIRFYLMRHLEERGFIKYQAFSAPGQIEFAATSLNK